MRLLLDTRVLLWWSIRSDRLPADLRAAVDDVTNQVHVSAVSTAEIAIKSSLGKLDVPPGLSSTSPGTGLTELPLTSAHAAVLADLPLHHRDPFDRMLIAQALVEGLILVTLDPWVRAYHVPVLPRR